MEIFSKQNGDEMFAALESTIDEYINGNNGSIVLMQQYKKYFESNNEQIIISTNDTRMKIVLQLVNI